MSSSAVHAGVLRPSPRDVLTRTPPSFVAMRLSWLAGGLCLQLGALAFQPRPVSLRAQRARQLYSSTKGGWQRPGSSIP
eukprot:scaffold327_cov257-Pinguiococcus_pyrenoidosus.AAC.48